MQQILNIGDWTKTEKGTTTFTGKFIKYEHPVLKDFMEEAKTADEAEFRISNEMIVKKGKLYTMPPVVPSIIGSRFISNSYRHSNLLSESLRTNEIKDTSKILSTPLIRSMVDDEDRKSNFSSTFHPYVPSKMSNISSDTSGEEIIADSKYDKAFLKITEENKKRVEK